MNAPRHFLHLSFVCVIYAAHDHAFCQHVSFSTEFQKRNCIAFKIDNIESSSDELKLSIGIFYFYYLLTTNITIICNKFEIGNE